MQRIIVLLIAAALIMGTIGCGGYNREPSIKPGDPSTRNTSDPPDATKMPVKRR